MARQMKDSGVEWIGEIPEDWKISKIKYVADFSPKCITASIAQEDFVGYAPMECIKQGYFIPMNLPYGALPKSLTPFTDNDIVIAKVTPCFENGNIAIMHSLPNNIGFGSSELFVLRSKDVSVKFLFYWLQNSAFVDRAISTMTGTGGLKRVSSSFIQNSPILLPDSDGQHRIADYLDAKCAEIDKVVEKTRETIEEYKKLKQSIITETVTKGLNSDAEMKDSGIPWIGKIPVEWSIERLQRHLREINHSNNPVQTKQILSLTNKLGVIPYETKGNIGNKSKEDYSDYKLAYPDTIVVNSMNVIIGSVGISNYFGCVSPVYYVFAPETGNNVRFLNYIFQTTGFQKELRCYANGILEIRLRVSSDKILKRDVAIPSVEEQKLIVSFLDAKCAELDSIIEKKERLIEELGSYKKSLIYECVTGKKEVQT